MRILLITDEVWNDQIHGNNILSNWFDGFDAEFANVYCSPGLPLNNTCNKYFQITDSMMLKSIITNKKAGNAFSMEKTQEINHEILAEGENKKLYTNLKSITTESLRALREAIWYFGKYDILALKKFINDFKPDIIFSPRFASIKILRLERIILNIVKVPIIAFTGDAEYSLKLLRLSPVFWMKKFILRKMLRKMMPNYSLYYTLSEEQLKEYQEEFGKKFKILRKSGVFKDKYKEKEINTPIKLVYAGKLYSNRWKNLIEVSKNLKEINKDEVKMVLEIYTRDTLNDKQLKLLNDGKNSFVKGSATPKELKEIYEEADISLHVESFDLKNRLLTKLSFSTKIIDCLASGCAVVVIAWDQHSGYTYLEKQDAAITMKNKKDVRDKLIELSNNKGLINEYAKKSWKCGHENHQKINVQYQILQDFKNVIKQYKET